VVDVDPDIAKIAGLVKMSAIGTSDKHARSSKVLSAAPRRLCAVEDAQQLRRDLIRLRERRRQLRARTAELIQYAKRLIGESKAFLIETQRDRDR
jgi:hypothetical protein